ncbi:MAG: hypothetical protein WD060_09520 [Pirellulales bacterium]
MPCPTGGNGDVAQMAFRRQLSDVHGDRGHRYFSRGGRSRAQFPGKGLPMVAADGYGASRLTP